MIKFPSHADVLKTIESRTIHQVQIVPRAGSTGKYGDLLAGATPLNYYSAQEAIKNNQVYFPTDAFHSGEIRESPGTQTLYLGLKYDASKATELVDEYGRLNDIYSTGVTHKNSYYVLKDWNSKPYIAVPATYYLATTSAHEIPWIGKAYGFDDVVEKPLNNLQAYSNYIHALKLPVMNNGLPLWFQSMIYMAGALIHVGRWVSTGPETINPKHDKNIFFKEDKDKNSINLVSTYRYTTNMTTDVFKFLDNLRITKDSIKGINQILFKDEAFRSGMVTREDKIHVLHLIGQWIASNSESKEEIARSEVDPLASRGTIRVSNTPEWIREATASLRADVAANAPIQTAPRWEEIVMRDNNENEQA